MLVSAVGWRGPERELYDWWRSGRLRLAISPALLEELRRVLGYPKLGFSEDEVEIFVSDVLARASVVSPCRTLEVIKDDPDDNRVLECALAAGARWVVLGDEHLLGVAEYQDIRIITARTALNALKTD